MQHARRNPIALAYSALLSTLLLAPSTFAMNRPYPGPHIETDDLLVVLIPHTPVQMAAFYEARGFPAEAIDIIRHTCFVTVHIENRSSTVIWLEPARWSFTANGKSLERLDRTWWDRQWNRIGLRQASRSTFGWTQLPDLRDLQPDEPVGGNLVFPGRTTRFDMTLNLPTGGDQRGRPIRLAFHDVECPREVASP